MAFTVTEEVGTCIFMVKCSYLEGRKNDKNQKIDFCFPIASVLFVLFKLLCSSDVCVLCWDCLQFGKGRGTPAFGPILNCFYSLVGNVEIETTQPGSA